MGRLDLRDVPRDEDEPRPLEIGFTGSRDYPRKDLVQNFVRGIARKYPGAVVVSGGRGNVDKTAEDTGAECGLTVISYRPHEDHIEVVKFDPVAGAWGAHSKILGHNNFVRNCFLRNSSIAFCDKVIAFWDLVSRGTADTISKARGKQRELFVYSPTGALLSSTDVAGRLKEVLG